MAWSVLLPEPIPAPAGYGTGRNRLAFRSLRLRPTRNPFAGCNPDRVRKLLGFCLDLRSPFARAIGRLVWLRHAILVAIGQTSQPATQPHLFRPVSSKNSPPSRLARFVLVCALAIFAAHTWMFREYVTDDAFISFRYQSHALAGEGLVFNVGERVAGWTNGLLILLVLPLEMLGFDALTGARILGVGSNLAILLMIALGFAVPVKRRPLLRTVPVLFLACNSSFIMQGLAGLGGSVFSMLILLAVCLLSRAEEQSSDARAVGGGIVLALALIARPEALFFAAALLLAVPMLSGDRRAAGRRSGLALLVFVPIAAGYVLWIYAYYGTFYQNSLTAKVGMTAEQLMRGGHYFVRFASAYPFHLAVAAALFALNAKANWTERLSLIGVVFFLVFYAVAGGDWMLGYRLYHPVLVLSAIGLPLVTEALLGPGQAPGALRRGAAIGAVAAGLIASLNTTRWDGRVRRAVGGEDYVNHGIEVGRWLRENLPPHSLLATNTAGSVAYYSGLPIVDMMGITDKEIAGRRDLPAGWKGIEKGDGEYVLQRCPDYIMLGSSRGSDTPMFLSDIELYGNPYFWRYYERMLLGVDEDTEVVLFRRRPSPATETMSEERLREIREVAANQLSKSAFRY